MLKAKESVNVERDVKNTKKFSGSGKKLRYDIGNAAKSDVDAKRVSYTNFNQFKKSVANIDHQSMRTLKKQTTPKVLKRLQMIASLSQGTHFSSEEVGRLLDMFSEHFHAIENRQKDLIAVDYASFLQTICGTFNITDENCLDGIFRAFAGAQSSSISEQEWIRGLSVFLRGTPLERARFCFTVYDRDGNGELSRDEVFIFLRTSLVKLKNDDDQDESIKEMVEMVFRKLDHHKDAKVTTFEFVLCAEDDPLMMECLGQVFPSEAVTETFECTFADKHFAFTFGR